jgi:hypothetical protein
MHLCWLVQLIALAYVVPFPHRLQIGEVKALSLMLWIGQIVHGAWNDVIDLPFAIVFDRHASAELPFQVFQ